MVLCISAGNFDPLIFVGVMSLGTQKILINDLVIATPRKLLTVDFNKQISIHCITVFWDGQTDGQSDCTPRPAFAFGDAGKNTVID